MSLDTPFLVFVGERYYALGGWSDYVGACVTQQAAQALALERVSQYWDEGKNTLWYHIVHLATMTIVEEVEGLYR
jgi:hypothetical protein